MQGESKCKETSTSFVCHRITCKVWYIGKRLNYWNVSTSWTQNDALYSK